jgi:polysaccharide export outer membrane protein
MCARLLWSTPVLILPILAILAGCQTKVPAFTDLHGLPPGPGTANYSTNKLEEGDVVSVTFQYSTNFNAVQKITLDGVLNLESVGPIKAAGKTPVELQNLLSAAYKPLIKDDVVTVKVISTIAGVYVAGAVFHPGKVPMERPMTVLEAIMEAGGFDPTRAKLSDVTVVRVDNGKQCVCHIDVKKVLAGEDETPFYLKPFDVVHVPTKVFNY